MISKFVLLLASSSLLGFVCANPDHIEVVPVAPAHVLTQYHSQNEHGEYSYGYSGGPSAKHETKTADGITQGGYSYIDAHGLPQTVSYVSDPVYGFRAYGTNIPQPVPPFVSVPGYPGPVPISAALAPADPPAVAEAKAHHYAETAAAIARVAHAPHSRRRRSLAAYSLPLPLAAAPLPLAYSYPSPYAYHAAPALPLAYHAAPLTVAPVPAVPVSTQHHSQNEAGEYSYGYANQDSAKEEMRTADGITRGSYSYRDPHGLHQSVAYIADPVHGFRAAGTNIPVAPHA